jgi:hypothetical protein
MTVVMNACSAVVGVLGIPLSGITWELLASAAVHPIYGWGSFNPATWSASCLVATLLSSVVEIASLRVFFQVTWTKKLFWWLALANLITVGMALLSIVISPPEL